MAETTPTCGNKRNSISRGEDGPALPLNKRVQSPVVFTGPDGKILTRDGNRDNGERWSAAHAKFDSVKAKQRILSRQEDAAADMASSTGTKKPSCMRQPAFSTPQPGKVKSVHFQTPISSFPSSVDSPAMPVGTIEYQSTPLPSSKARPPLSGRKMKMKAAAKLQLLDDHETHASRLVQARLDFSMGRQERAYIAWLNHVLGKPATAVNQMSNFEDFISRNSSQSTPNSNSRPGAGDLKLIDEVYWDEDCENASPRNQPSVGKSPRSALRPLNGLASRYTGNPTVKRPLKETFLGVTPEKSLLARTDSPATPYLSSKRLKMITEHGFSYCRDLHMQDVCRLSDLSRRLNLHFSQDEREEILTTITQLAKHIDEGRLRMKKDCAILVDVALRRKALYVLLNYNSYWLRIGLHVVLGHTALLNGKLSGDVTGVGVKDLTEEYALLEVFLERHFLAHAGLSKAYATNKAIDGLYREGYAEALSRVILKRFFLLVLVLDKAKRLTSLKISDGIDGLDGGSPSLFRSDARVKSSRQALQEFLSDVMHGEGDVIGNLGNLGYHVYHHQVPLADYDFSVVDLIEDLQDGVRLCRLVQLLAANDTFFLEHIQVPSNGRKRQIHNCQIALESLAQAGVPLEDEEGCSICAEDIVGGNRDKVFPLLWNIMVHLQIPLLVSRPRLCQEIAKLQGTEGRFALGLNIGTVELLLKWTQVVCMISGNLNIRNFRTSFADGQALCYIVNLYLPLFLAQEDVLRPLCHMNLQIDSTPNLRGPFSPAYKKAVAHNFGLVQAVARKLGNIPEVLQLVDLLGDPAMSERNIIIFVAFLCSRLLKEEPLDDQVRRRESIDWEAGDQHAYSADDVPALCSYSSRRSLESESPIGFDRSYTVPWPKEEARRSDISPTTVCNICCDNNANNPEPEAEYNEEILHKVCKVQAWWRAHRARELFLRKKRAVQTIQKRWRSFSESVRTRCATRIQAHWRGYLLRQVFLRWREASLIHRECHEREQAALVIQAYYRAWIRKRKYLETVGNMCKIQALWWANEARGNFLIQWKAVRIIESAWIDYLFRKRSHFAPIVFPHWKQCTARHSLIRLSTASSLNQSWFRDRFEEYEVEEEYKMVNVTDWLQDNELQSTEYFSTVIQACWRARVARKRFLKQRQAAVLIQVQWRVYSYFKKITAAVRIQAKWRCFASYRSFKLMRSSALLIQCFYRGNLERRQYQRQKRSIIWLQARCRGRLQMKRYEAALESISRIQSFWRVYKCRKQFMKLKSAVVVVQACWRGYQHRETLSKSRQAASFLQKRFRGIVQRRAFLQYREAARIIQTFWRSRKLRQHFLEVRRCAVLIQSHFRTHVQRRRYAHILLNVCKIQAAWRALQTRKRMLEHNIAAVVIQTRFRAYILGRQRRGQFLQERSAVSRIQRCFKAFKFRRNFRRLVNASRIQRTWRAHSLRREFLARRKAAVVIQRTYRAHCRGKAEKFISSICKIQAFWRAKLELRHFLRQKTAAKLIQLQFRALMRRKKEVLLCSVCKIQAIWRAHKSRSQFLLQKKSAVTIQAGFRCYKARLMFLEQKRAAVVIQAAFRAFNQTRFKPIVEPTFCGTVRRISKIQAVWRALKARRMISEQRRAAQTIQCLWRYFVIKRKNVRRNAAAVVLQSWFRALIQRRRFKRERNAALAVQAHVKGWIQRRRYRGVLGIIRKAQALFKAKKVRVQYRNQKIAACKIQAAWRGFWIRKMVDRWGRASSTIQARFRGYQQRKFYKSYINAVVRCQALMRGHLIRQKIGGGKVGDYKIQTVSNDVDKCMAAVQIQSGYSEWEGCLGGRLQVQELAKQTGMNETVQDLSVYKETEEELPLDVNEKLLQSVLKLQAMFRLAAARRKQVLSRSTRRSSRRLSARVLDQLFGDIVPEDQRGLTPVENVVQCLQLERSCSEIGIVRYEYCEQAYAAMMIQALWKGYSVRKIFASRTNKQLVDCKEQQLVNGTNFGPEKLRADELSAGRTIFRWLTFWRERSHFVKIKKVTVFIQRLIRGWLCRCKFLQARKSVVCIQAHWRGFLLRREISLVNQELLQLRQRIQCTAASVQDSDRLGNRLTEALALLLGQKTVTGILSICRTIDVATHHSKSCCDRLAEAGAVTKILNLIQTINRSPPHEQVLKHALTILKNLAHHLHLRLRIAEAPGAISIITEQLHMFRYKEDIFMRAMEVLKQVCELPVGIAVLQREPQIFRRLQLVAQSLDRKIQVEKRNLDKLPPSTAPVQRKLAEKKLVEASGQFSSVMSLLKGITQLEHSQRRKTTPMSVPVPSVSKQVPRSCHRPSLAPRPSLAQRVPLQDRTNW
ncbi:abnormal spindle-like microcephaly-associated protein [Marchantia polymorpha subsp. ruderalis]|uniref:Calponin-homology (CH) domain-containing protein n=2 Tax=Marchantia polymorpha TaxID=3197 RepID=A0AAF6AM85_MARPO|nr:hypothetical protein MARPO_0043s0047 [Marchantia polymorpha]BBM97555.1 hypothetical protein Mp_1g06540 [Marchantia polymorpha subsp. ruderalis]|eukprot:PTQ39797.1 hypothetical protein MARPO_0043s0047 [Marchantia polymorpha]